MWQSSALYPLQWYNFNTASDLLTVSTVCSVNTLARELKDTWFTTVDSKVFQNKIGNASSRLLTAILSQWLTCLKKQKKQTHLSVLRKNLKFRTIRMSVFEHSCFSLWPRSPTFKLHRQHLNFNSSPDCKGMCFFCAPSSPRRYIPRNTHFSNKQTALLAEEQRSRCLLSHRDSPDALRVLCHDIQRKHDVPTGLSSCFWRRMLRRVSSSWVGFWKAQRNAAGCHSRSETALHWHVWLVTSTMAEHSGRCKSR